jgi:hypothetical protein
MSKFIVEFTENDGFAAGAVFTTLDQAMDYVRQIVASNPAAAEEWEIVEEIE